MRSPLLLLCILFALILPIFAGDYLSSLIRGRIFQGRYEATQPGVPHTLFSPLSTFFRVDRVSLKLSFTTTLTEISSTAQTSSSATPNTQTPKWSPFKSTRWCTSTTIPGAVIFIRSPTTPSSTTWSKIQVIFESPRNHDQSANKNSAVQSRIGRLRSCEDEHPYERINFRVQCRSWAPKQRTFLSIQTWQTIAYCLYIACIAGVQLYSASKLTAMLDAPNFVAAGKMSLVTFSCCAIVDMTHGF